MIEMIGLFLAAALLLLIGYIGEVVSATASGGDELEDDSCIDAETEAGKE